MQDYNLYLMENEYYSDDQPNYKKSSYCLPQTRADKKGRPLTCENFRLQQLIFERNPIRP